MNMCWNIGTFWDLDAGADPDVSSSMSQRPSIPPARLAMAMSSR